MFNIALLVWSQFKSKQYSYADVVNHAKGSNQPELSKNKKQKQKTEKQSTAIVIVEIIRLLIFSQGGPFSSEADTQRGPGLKKKDTKSEIQDKNQ